MATALANPNSPIERYAQFAKDAGCQRAQIENFIRAGIVLQPRQLAFAAAARQCDRNDGPEEVLFGGAMGGGKSHGLLAQIGADDCQRVPGLKVLLLRKVGSANKENFEDLRMRLFTQLPHHYRRQEGVLVFGNGSRIIAGHFQNESDVDKYLGLEYDIIATEEATTLSASKIKVISTRCRTSKDGWRPRMYYTANPGGVSHQVFKKGFVDPYRREQESPERRYVPSTVRDNAFVDPQYASRLENLTGWQKRAWLDGDWNIAAGQFFTTFRDTIHVIKPFDVPKAWRKWCSLDYGFTHYTAVHLFAQSGDGEVYLLDEHGEQQWLPQRHAPAIRAMLKRNGVESWQLSRFVAGADVFAKRPNGGTVADTYKEAGINLSPANDDRINGAAEVLTRLGDTEAGIRPSLYIFDRCARVIEQIPAMQHDPHRPEDVLKVDVDDDGIGGDDFYDSARYGIMEAHKVVSVPVVGGQRMAVAGFKPR